ncbi:MAG: hypothetical protein P794_01045 [Epsilonproteobacteria bacterium (ex Lamellibrachia satsuma)]|nr:MAG: hypothetical protein P794_01045 [Epsilonproteobacteria bacterium (ex Lamellibrachia satsuma)]
MNQTKKRLSIIKLAISITDIETIQLQVLKLSALKADLKIQEIISMLQAENYAQAQRLITTYIETPTEEILQRVAQEEKQRKEVEEKTLIDELDLFMTTPETDTAEEKTLFDFSTLEPESPPKKEHESVDFDSLLNIEADDILPENIDIDITHPPKDTFFDEPQHQNENIKENCTNTTFINKDTFFDIEDEKEEIPVTLEDKEKKDNLIVDEEISEKEEDMLFFDEESHSETAQKEPVVKQAGKNTVSSYKAITYIDQKLKNMLTQYPPVEESNENFPSVNAWLLQISNSGYSDQNIEEMIEHVAKLRESGKKAETALLLLISGATESKFAQFMLARELYRGEILQKNIPEAFTLINRLAINDNFPEAICDLAQFYENGIGIDKNKKKAEELYHEAMELGVKRAAVHYERIQKANKGLLGKLFGK